jgi:DUF4097 and DUF4098 domain-containing protein YvlB
MHKLPLLLAGALIVGAGGGTAAQDFNWSKPIPGGKWLEVKGFNGNIRAVPADGDLAEIVARKTARASNPQTVEIRLVEHEGGVTVCAVYPTPKNAKQPNGCEAGAAWSPSSKDNDVAVDFEVRVPVGVKLRAQTVNGGLSAERLADDVVASTVNGDLNITTSGTALATTRNGSIWANMGRADWTSQADFTTVNGSITIVCSCDLNVQLKALAHGGDIDSDWPLKIKGRLGSREASGTIGTGGPLLNLSTENGNIRLRRSI